MRTTPVLSGATGLTLILILGGCGDSGTPVRPVPEHAPDFIRAWGTFGSADGQFNQPLGITADSDGVLYVTDTQHHRVEKFNSDGEFLSSWGVPGLGPGQFRHPTAIVVSPLGRVYVGDLGFRVQVFSPEGDYLQWLDFFCVEAGLALDPDGNLLVLGSRILNRFPFIVSEGPFLYKLTPEGEILRIWAVPHTHEFDEWTPRGLAVDRHGNMFITGAESHRVGFRDKVKDGEFIWKLDRSGKFITRWEITGEAGNGLSLEGIALDSQGSMYVADWLGGSVRKLNRWGDLLAEWSEAGDVGLPIRGPVGMLVDAEDRIYVVDWGYHRIMKFGYN